MNTKGLQVAAAGLSELALLGLPGTPETPAAQSVQYAAGRLSSANAQQSPTAEAPFKLVDLVKAGPSGTVASTAAVQTAARSAAIKAAPLYGSAGLVGTANTANGSYRPGSAMQDLLRAAEKAVASGLGEWHLQALQNISPQFQEHVLMGALGPETLKHKHQLTEQRILQLYGLLHRHSTGFQQEVQGVFAGAQHVEQLLASVWTAFAQLWDECVQFSFHGEVMAAMQELQSTYSDLLSTQDQLAATQQENAALKERCNEFVKANLDHMLGWRSLKTKADALEGEVAMLSSANSEVSLRAAATNARNTQLTLQLEGLGARLAAAEQQIQDREMGLENARVAMLEKDSGLRRLEAHVAALEQQMVAAGQTAKKQDSAISELQQQVQHRDQLVQDADRRIADKQRAYNLLHADFANQKAEAAEAVSRAAELDKQVTALRQQIEMNKVFVGRAEDWQKRWEVCQMEVEDLQSANARAALRRQELVSSYWPVMERLGQAEDVVDALSKELRNLGQQPTVSLAPRDYKAADVRIPADTAQPQQSGATSTTSNAPVDVCSQKSRQGTVQLQHKVQQQQQQQKEAQQPLQPAVGDVGSHSNLAQAGHQDNQPTAKPQLPPGQHQQDSHAGVSSGMRSVMKAELQQLKDSYLVLQDAYWAQKERLLALEVEVGQLRVQSERATAIAAEATGKLSTAQGEAAEHSRMRVKLEADIVGCRSWIRELEKTEQAYLKAMREQGALEDAAVTAKRQLEDCRTALAAAQADCRLANAAAEAVGRERTQLLHQMAQDMNQASLVEQALQQVHKQGASSSRAAGEQLQTALDLTNAELAKAKAQLQDMQQNHSAVLAEQQNLKGQLQQSAYHERQLRKQFQMAQQFLTGALTKLERLESRVSFVNSSSMQDGTDAGQTVEIAVEAVVHLLERLLVTLQCLAADAGTISNAAAAAKVEVLVRELVQGLEAAAAKPAGKVPASKERRLPASAAVTVLRNAAGATNKQRVQELEQQVNGLQLQLSDCSSQLSAAWSSNARLQRTMQLKQRALASHERQLAAMESQLQQLQSSQVCNEQTIAQLQQEVAQVKLDYAQAAAAATAQAGELQAAISRAAGNEAELQQLRQSAAEASANCQRLAEEMQKAVAAGRQDALESRRAASAAAAATLQAQQLQKQLEVVQEQCCKLEREVKESRQRADISVQSARDAEFRAVQTTTLLADARRALEYTQQLLQDSKQLAETNESADT